MIQCYLTLRGGPYGPNLSFSRNIFRAQFFHRYVLLLSQSYCASLGEKNWNWCVVFQLIRINLHILACGKIHLCLKFDTKSKNSKNFVSVMCFYWRHFEPISNFEVLRNHAKGKSVEWPPFWHGTRSMIFFVLRYAWFDVLYQWYNFFPKILLGKWFSEVESIGNLP